MATSVEFSHHHSPQNINTKSGQQFLAFILSSLNQIKFYKLLHKSLIGRLFVKLS